MILTGRGAGTDSCRLHAGLWVRGYMCYVCLWGERVLEEGALYLSYSLCLGHGGSKKIEATKIMVITLHDPRYLYTNPDLKLIRVRV
jgi:hypothetical protein